MKRELTPNSVRLYNTECSNTEIAFKKSGPRSLLKMGLGHLTPLGALEMVTLSLPTSLDLQSAQQER